jgi:TPR repeat protein
MNNSTAVEYFKLSADQGNGDAQNNYGLCLCAGERIALNKSLAAQYFKMAADQGIADAKSNSERCLAKEEGRPFLEKLGIDMGIVVLQRIHTNLVDLFVK